MRWIRSLAEIAPHGDPAQRNRVAGFALPPLAQVDDARKAVALIREPALVDDDAGIHLPVADRRHDLVERHHTDVRLGEFGREQANEQRGGRQAAGNRDRLG